MLTESNIRVQQYDTVQWQWYVDRKEMNLWVATSSLVVGVSLEVNKSIIKDACYFFHNKRYAVHQCDSALLKWQARKFSYNI